LIRGGLFKINTKISNNGGAGATNVNWSITLDGGVFIGKETTGTNDISAGGKITISSNLIFGFGSTKVTVTVEEPWGSIDERSQNGFVLFFFINIRPSG